MSIDDDEGLDGDLSEAEDDGLEKGISLELYAESDSDKSEGLQESSNGVSEDDEAAVDSAQKLVLF